MQLGEQSLLRLKSSSVAVFGIGGVGGHCADSLARAGIGRLDVIDKDRICITNINRQIIAAMSTIGRYKSDVMRERILDINPEAHVGAYKLFYGPDTANSIDLSGYDYIVDAMDTVTAKVELILRAERVGVPIISCMGAANKLDPAALIVEDIYSTDMCPVARVMRRELRRRGVKSLKVVYTKEPPIPPTQMEFSCCGHPNCPVSGQTSVQRRQTPASNSFVPPVAGLIMAGEVVRGIIGLDASKKS